MEIFLLVLFLVISILILIIGVMVEKNIVGFLLGASCLVSTFGTLEFAYIISTKD